MKLNLEQIKSVTCGAESVKYSDGEYRFFRLSDEELSIFSGEFSAKSRATAGIEIRLETDASELVLYGFLRTAESRSYSCFDIFKNDEIIGHIRNFDKEDAENPPLITEKSYPLGEFSGRFDLGEGNKRIRIVFPFSAEASLYEIELVGASYLTPAIPEKKMLLLGDSITQGYDSESPCATYASKLAFALGFEGFNKGVGGARFTPEFGLVKCPFEPQLITVAYGTNDWNRFTREEFTRNAEGFYKNLSKTYPDVKIFAISPIWRANCEEDREFKFSEIEGIIKNIADSLDNVIFIPGFDLVPHKPECFGDLRLHPRKLGFEFFFENLIKEIKKHL